MSGARKITARRYCITARSNNTAGPWVLNSASAFYTTNYGNPTTERRARLSAASSASAADLPGSAQRGAEAQELEATIAAKLKELGYGG